MPFKIVRNDITKVKADVIVNTANPKPICASGTDFAIYEAAGKEQFLAERAGIGKIARGDIAVTGAYNLKAKYIIHTVEPVWTDGHLVQAVRWIWLYRKLFLISSMILCS